MRTAKLVNTLRSEVDELRKRPRTGQVGVQTALKGNDLRATEALVLELQRKNEVGGEGAGGWVGGWVLLLVCFTSVVVDFRGGCVVVAVVAHGVGCERGGNGIVCSPLHTCCDRRQAAYNSNTSSGTGARMACPPQSWRLSVEQLSGIFLQSCRRYCTGSSILRTSRCLPIVPTAYICSVMPSPPVCRMSRSGWRRFERSPIVGKNWRP